MIIPANTAGTRTVIFRTGIGVGGMRRMVSVVTSVPSLRMDHSKDSKAKTLQMKVMDISVNITRKCSLEIKRDTLPVFISY